MRETCGTPVPIGQAGHNPFGVTFRRGGGGILSDLPSEQLPSPRAHLTRRLAR